MDDPSLWSGRVVAADGSRIAMASASEISRHDGAISVVFDGVPRRPMHVSLRWNGAAILSATDLSAPVEEMSVNPGRIVWEVDSRRLYFVANVDELSQVCASQRRESAFFEDPG